MSANDPVNPNPTANWWTTPPSGWAEKAESTHAEWRHKSPDTQLDAAAAISAMAFGYGSRAAYPAERPWEAHEPDLESDWLKSGRGDEHEWQLVRDAAKHGWSASEERVVQGGRP